MTWMSDEAIETAKSLSCPCCPAAPGEECEALDGTPLIESPAGRPVHIKRLEP